MKPQNMKQHTITMLLNDLQSAWSCLHDAVLCGVAEEHKAVLLNQIDECMCWGQVYNLSQMQKIFQELMAKVQHVDVDSEVKVWMGNVKATLTEALLYTQSH